MIKCLESLIKGLKRAGLGILVAGVLGFNNLAYSEESSEKIPIHSRHYEIAFVSDRDGNDEIYTINSDSSGLRNLTNNPANDTDPQWCPVPISKED